MIAMPPPMERSALEGVLSSQPSPQTGENGESPETLAHRRRLAGEARLAQAFHHELKVGRFLVGQDTPSVLQRIVWIEPKRLAPFVPRFGRTTKVAIR
jgi:hypothetical protein